jgi:hypothetical protein
MAITKAGAPAPSAPATSAGAPDYGTPLYLDSFLRILLMGDTGAGKTSQIGLLAEYIYATEDKKTVVFTADKGGIQPIKPYMDLSIVEVIPYQRSIDPWVWITHAVRGEAKVNGKWVKVTEGKGLAVNEGLTAFADLLMMNLADHSAANPNQAVGGESAWMFEVKDGDTKFNIASNTQSHYGLAQLRIMKEIWEADPGVASLWTAILDRSSDPTGGGGLLVPKSAGNKQGANIPRWFDYTFRINAVPSDNGPARHVLYLTTHLDKQSKGAKVIANARLPLAGSEAKVDATIDPADIVKALLQIRRRNVVAKDSISERIQKLRENK